MSKVETSHSPKLTVQPTSRLRQARIMADQSKTKCDQIRAFQFDELKMELRILNQKLLPQEMRFELVEDADAGYRVIREMQVRGAPCIAAVACLSLAVEIWKLTSYIAGTESETSPFDDLKRHARNKAQLLISSRPTAVNLRRALDSLIGSCEQSHDVPSYRMKMREICTEALSHGYECNRWLGEYGRLELVGIVAEAKTEHIIGCEGKICMKILTHCNTGALATVGHGTALGVVRSLQESGMIDMVYCTETRPYNQGSRLTAWELLNESIPVTLIADSMVAYLMATERIDAVIVGADRVVANGDTANKIGTLQIAIMAKHFGVPFYIAAPTQTIDLNTKDGSSIEIELRPNDEFRNYTCNLSVPKNVDIWNPCFDVTPSELIRGIITERGICKANQIERFMATAGCNPRTTLIF